MKHSLIFISLFHIFSHLNTMEHLDGPANAITNIEKADPGTCTVYIQETTWPLRKALKECRVALANSSELTDTQKESFYCQEKEAEKLLDTIIADCDRIRALAHDHKPHENHKTAKIRVALFELSHKLDDAKHKVAELTHRLECKKPHAPALKDKTLKISAAAKSVPIRACL